MIAPDYPPKLIYRIEVEGQINPAWSEWLNGLTIKLVSERPPITELCGVMVDQARLRGILNKLWDLNLALISLERIPSQGG